MQKVRGQIILNSPTACRCRISGSISLRYNRDHNRSEKQSFWTADQYSVLFHLSLTVLIRYRSLEIFRLRGLVPLSSDKVSRAPSYFSYFSTIFAVFLNYRAFTFFGTVFQTAYQITRKYGRNFWCKNTPDPLSLATTSGISVDFFSLSYLDVSLHSVFRDDGVRPVPTGRFHIVPLKVFSP